VRYRHKEAACTLITRPHNQAEVRFDTPQSAITPGQGAVFYIGEEVIGGGFIK
jgi:tRNA-specific 2-thiouridylase